MKFRYLLLLFLLSVHPRALNAAPQLVLQGNIDSDRSSYAVSDDGRWVAELPQSGSPIVLHSGRHALLWGEIAGSTGHQPLLFTPDGTRLLTHEWREDMLVPTIVEWAIPSGRKLQTFLVEYQSLWCDSNCLRGVSDSNIVEYDLRTGRRTAKVPFERPASVDYHEQPLSFSHNGRYLVGGSNHEVLVWNARTGRLHSRFTGATEVVGRSTVSDDGRWVAFEDVALVGSYTMTSPDGEEVSFPEDHAEYKLCVWNLAKKKKMWTFDGYETRVFPGGSMLKFAPDSRMIFADGAPSLERIDAFTGHKTELTPATRGQQFPTAGLALSNDCAWLVGATAARVDRLPGRDQTDSGTTVSQVTLCPLQAPKNTANRQVKFPAHALNATGYVQWSPDGCLLAGGPKLALSDARSGKLLARGAGQRVNSFFWQDARTICSQTYSSVQWWSVPEMKQIAEFKVPRSFNLSVSPDGRTVLSKDVGQNTATGESTIWVWDSRTRKVLRKIQIADAPTPNIHIENIAWLPDSKRILLSTRTKLMLVNVSNGQTEKVQPDPSDPNFVSHVSSTVFYRGRVSPDGKWVALMRVKGETTVVFDLHTFEVDPPAGLKWWARILAETKAQQGRNPYYAARSPDGRLTASPQFTGGGAYSDERVSIWNNAQNREVLRLYVEYKPTADAAPGWIALTPSGYYDCSASAEKYLRWRDEKGFWPIAKSRARFKRPGLVRELLAPPRKPVTQR